MRSLLGSALDLVTRLFAALGRETGKAKGTPRRLHKAKHERGMIRDRLRRTRDIRKHVAV